jgi:hypothetical protein
VQVRAGEAHLQKTPTSFALPNGQVDLSTAGPIRGRQ